MTAAEVRPVAEAAGRGVFRWMNDQVRRTQRDWPTREYDLICECGDSDCLRVLTIDRHTYESSIALAPLHFVVLPGHQRPDLEDVVETRPGHVVVRPRQLPPATEATAA